MFAHPLTSLYIISGGLQLPYQDLLASFQFKIARFNQKFPKIFSFTNSIIASIGRVIIGPVIGFLIIIFFDLSGFGAGVILIQSAMPSAILNYLIGPMYSPKEIVDNIASTIVVSTLMSFITVPIVVFFALKYFY